MTIYAWIGEDEHGSGEVGIKQGINVHGVLMPLVSIHRDKLDTEHFRRQLAHQAAVYRKTISLVRFESTETLLETP